MARNTSLTFDDVSHELDCYDDWLFRSTKRYQHISMYDLDKPAQAVAWFKDEVICLATCDSVNNELQLSSIPDIVDDKDTIAKDRELSILGAASCSGSSKALSSAPDSFMNSNCVLRTEYDNNAIYLHQIPTDLPVSKISAIELVHIFRLTDLAAYSPVAILHHQSSMTSVQIVSNIQLSDVNTLQSRQIQVRHSYASGKTDEEVSSLVEHACVGDSLLCSTVTGRLLLLDIRTPSGSFVLDAPAAEVPDNECWKLCSWCDHRFVLSSDHNRVSVFDDRYTGKVLATCRLEAPPWTGRRTSQYHSISACKDWLSVSGKDNQIRIYRLDQLHQDNTTPCQPLFVHDGHLPNWDNSDLPLVINHCWSKPSSDHLTVLSSSNTGQLHTWMFDEKVFCENH